MAVSRKDHLIDTAQRLFYQQGFRFTGIDTVLAESGVAKQTLYNHFRSKEELIIATLQRRDDQFLNMLRKGVSKYESVQQTDKRFTKVLALFDAIDEWIKSDKFFGCMFINASVEYPRQDDPVHVACTNHKKLVIQFIEKLVMDIETEDSHTLARQIALLADGAIVNAHTTNDREAAIQAKAVVRTLLESYNK